jgi:3-methyladenine DNA glycosylase/8-oxoguanine DNA glycosylase
VGFWSPYEAAAWTIIGHRIRMTQAAALKARISERLGEPVSFGGRVIHAFPSPARAVALAYRLPRAGYTRADPGDQRELAALPHLGHAVAADPPGG